MPLYRSVTMPLLAITIAGCSATASKKGEDAASAPVEVADGSQPAGSEGTAYGLDNAGGLTTEELGGGGFAGASDADLLSQRSIYFEYDSELISEDYRRVIEVHARFLNENPDISITLEGHADERGSREYNLALGERRALAVGKMLSLLGLQQSRVNTLSFGEEKPHARGNDEPSWRLNRRVDLVY